MSISDSVLLFGDPIDDDPNTNKGALLIKTSISMIALSFLAVLLRFISRKVLKTHLLLDDWIILAALPFAWCGSIIDVYGATTGYLGQHASKAPSSYIPMLMQGLYVFDITYNFAIALAKLSMLALYWRIFHVPSFKLPLAIIAVITLAWLGACVHLPYFPALTSS